MLARDIMTTKVASVRAGTSLADAVGLLLVGGYSGLPVVDANDRVVGILTEGDLLRRVELGTEKHRPRWLQMFVGPARLATEFVHSESQHVDDVMTDEVVTVTEDTDLEEVVALMEKKRVKRLPVVRDERLVGIVSRADLVRALAEFVLAPVAAPAVAGASSDAAIREQVSADLARYPWSGAQSVTVTVDKGVVTLSGVIYNESLRRALIVVAEKVAGVQTVVDELVVVEPLSGAMIGAV